MLQLLERLNYDTDTYDLSDQLWQNLLEVDFEAFLNVIDNEDDFIKLLNDIHINFIIWLAGKIGLTNIKENRNEILRDIYQSYRHNELVKLIVLLLLFFKDKRKETLLVSAKILVSDEVYHDIIELELVELQKLLLIGLFICQEDYKKMVLWLQLAKSHIGGFTECIAIPDIEDDELKSLQVKKKIDEGLKLSLNNAGERDFNKLLQSIEQRISRDKKESAYICHKIVDGDLYFYCLRNTKRVMIREIKDTIWGNDTELIVLEFTDSYRSLRQRSTKGFGQELASELVTHFSGIPVRYVPATNASGVKAVHELINTLIEEKDSHFQFRELYAGSMNLKEAPSLIIRWNNKQQIGSAIRQLVNEFGLSVLDLNKIVYIKVGFQTEGESDKKYHQFIIYFNKYNEERIVVTFSTTFALKQKRADFVKVLRGYGVNAISKRRD